MILRPERLTVKDRFPRFFKSQLRSGRTNKMMSDLGLLKHQSVSRKYNCANRTIIDLNIVSLNYTIWGKSMNREWTGTLNWVLREHCISIKEEGGWGAEKRSQISRSDMMLRYFLWCLPPTLWHSGETHPNHVGLATWQGEMEKCSLTGCWWWQSLSDEFK